MSGKESITYPDPLGKMAAAVRDRFIALKNRRSYTGCSKGRLTTKIIGESSF